MNFFNAFALGERIGLNFAPVISFFTLKTCRIMDGIFFLFVVLVVVGSLLAGYVNEAEKLSA